MKARSLDITLTKFPIPPDPWNGEKPVFEFHILASLREKYKVARALFSISGNVILPDFHAARVLAQSMNEHREAGKRPERAVKAGQINAMGLIDEILHYVLRLYEESANPGVFSRALAYLEQESGKAEVSTTLLKFGGLYPPADVYAGGTTVKAFLAKKTGSKPHSEILLEELILLYFANINPAFGPFRELFDDTELSLGSRYRDGITGLEAFFRTEKRFGPEDQFIFDLLRAPILASPNSLEGQLEFIKKRWGLILSGKYLTKLLGAGDLLREESKSAPPAGGTRPETVVPRYPPWDRAAGDRSDPERFTADLDWMPRIVILAKNTYVWLAQLSKKYRRPITRLDEIPDEELDQLARWNVTGLWLIGIWERSSASQMIKQMTGNPEAVASAYSIYDYDIAAEIGGEDAFLNLRHRAWQRGIRMAGDMVPNHVGIYSKWVVEHPDYFVQSEYPPFPNYSFTGSNLSQHPDVEIRVEDGYWTRRDAAVVFQRIDRRTGGTRYVYHGNDGTNMPWNDTAQLDFLRAEVRESVIRTILHVAGKFSIIRFDAAMTLTKQHFQRLWYPQPGSGGDIPSRADHAMTRDDFDRAFPQEFWREVVDRINAEMPQTLLLAEAFWLLEGYFVRTLGMHRVYNSAFMHMLMREENAKYRALIVNTLGYNPEILKRYVNFMSNPDEETAIAQFGRDDKYFGVAVMMVTLPGLPMLAHGQIEGFHEKYGMEYKRAYYDEQPDEGLIRRHERELFPLMKKRRLFSHVEHFEMYDLIDAGGSVNDNVFAYSNRDGDERALICYHNKYEECSGFVKNAVPKVGAVGGGAEKGLVRKNLVDALGLESRDGVFYLFRDHKSGLEFIRSARELRERGMFVHLRAFEYQVFMDFRPVEDTDGIYSRLAASLEGGGVADLGEALKDLRLKPVHEVLSSLLEKATLDRVHAYSSPTARGASPGQRDLGPVLEKYGRFLGAVSSFLGKGGNSAGEGALLEERLERLKLLTRDSLPAGSAKGIPAKHSEKIVFHERGRLIGTPGGLGFLLAWLFTGNLGKLTSPDDAVNASALIFDRLKLASPIQALLGHVGQSGERIHPTVEWLKLLIRFQETFSGETNGEVFRSVAELFDDEEIRNELKVNVHKGVLYYNKELFETLLEWLVLVALLKKHPEAAGGAGAESAGRHSADSLLLTIKNLSDRSGFRLERLKELLAESTHTFRKGDHE